MVATPYTKNPYLPRLRARAVRLVRQGDWSMRRVARYIGVQASTISRWMKRSTSMELRAIDTHSSRPRGHPRTLDQKIVQRIIELRTQRKRCADVIHAQLLRENIKVSISSIYRTLKRNSLIPEKSKWKKYHLSGVRPLPEKPGLLVETDSIHIPLLPLEKKKRIYIFTLIDVFSRWAYAKASVRLTAHLLLEFVREAQRKVSFRFECVQSDHGPEFTSHFTIFVQADGIRHRHSRVRKPNDNAHIERFNRTIQEEMRTEILRYKTNIPLLNQKIVEYLIYYNTERLHMGINYQTPDEVLRSL